MIPKKIFITLFIGFAVVNAYAQKDSAKIEYSQEKYTKSHKLDEAICDILTRREKSDKNLWKVNLLGTFWGGFDISCERKITSKWCYNIQSISSFNSGAPKSFYTAIMIMDDNYRSSFYILSNYKMSSLFDQELNFQIRYYHNLDRRTRIGKKIGFSGNYFGLIMDNEFVYFTPNYNNSYYIHGIYSYLYINSWNFIYGIQRKIGKVGYIDGRIGLGLRHDYFNVYFNDYNTYDPRYHIFSQRMELNIYTKLAIGIAF